MKTVNLLVSVIRVRLRNTEFSIRVLTKPVSFRVTVFTTRFESVRSNPCGSLRKKWGGETPWRLPVAIRNLGNRQITFFLGSIVGMLPK